MHPIHFIEDDEVLFNELADLSVKIFGQPLTLDRLSGKSQFRVGETTTPAPPIDKVSNQYIAELAELVPLHEQGDGMQSVLGVLIPTVAAVYPVVLIDEPEAFLHPPQARILGAALSGIAASRGIQIIIATHDRNIVAGLLDTPDVPVTVARLTRNGNEARIHQLESDKLREVWNSPSLRYTNILDGLFHQFVVLAENERDCGFYAATLSEYSNLRDHSVQPHDVLFLPTNGKHSMAQLATVLSAVGVKVVASPDLDVLNEERTIKLIVNSVGGDWDSMHRNYSTATNEFRQPRRKLTNADVQVVISSILEKDSNAIYTGDVKRSVQASLQVESEWSRLKDYGAVAFKAERAAADTLLADLDAVGVVAVRVGELEGFASKFSKGASWLREALADNAHKTPEAFDHIRRIVSAGLASQVQAHVSQVIGADAS
ncbi:ATP-dependent nuclease [Prescottella equi]|uniref:ATP-dependent nuclease n=1 Tax=Rhodococcus hoagii TaxID=43767 RepID=UPI0015858438|nr:AAA family ATPase [Prescottella equi]